MARLKRINKWQPADLEYIYSMNGKTEFITLEECIENFKNGKYNEKNLFTFCNKSGQGLKHCDHNFEETQMLLFPWIRDSLTEWITHVVIE